MLWIKTIHLSAVLLSFAGFILRTGWMLMDSPMLTRRWVKVLPHIIDTVLLISALWLVYLMSLPLLQTDWLLAKIIALLVYIVLGTMALKRARTKLQRLIFALLAILVFLYIVSVAMSKSVYGFIALI
ncbi:MAG TPA: SirB2 family protein [Gammaproteobacteria bacterium]